MPNSILVNFARLLARFHAAAVSCWDGVGWMCAASQRRHRRWSWPSPGVSSHLQNPGSGADCGNRTGGAASECQLFGSLLRHCWRVYRPGRSSCHSIGICAIAQLPQRYSGSLCDEHRSHLIQYWRQLDPEEFLCMSWLSSVRQQPLYASLRPCSAHLLWNHLLCGLSSIELAFLAAFCCYYFFSPSDFEHWVE